MVKQSLLPHRLSKDVDFQLEGFNIPRNEGEAARMQKLIGTDSALLVAVNKQQMSQTKCCKHHELKSVLPTAQDFSQITVIRKTRIGVAAKNVAGLLF